jgi:enoyl-CoA hydratase/carnithine racemase
MSEVIISKSGAVLELLLDRAAKKNALTFDMYRALTEGLTRAEQDDDVRAVLIVANGETFCAGIDISEILGGASEFASAPPLKFVEKLAQFQKPIVAAVHGAAVGIGATLLLHCDLIYASETARLHMPFVQLGLVPEAASSLLLPERVGLVVAAEMLLLGESIDARRALELGLFNKVVPRGELKALARAKADELAQRPPQALRLAKSLVRRDPTAVLARIHEEGRIFAERVTSPEAAAAFMSFLERR